MQFRAFCRNLDRKHYVDERESIIAPYLFDEVKNVPCRAEFYRYVQWHNYAFQTTSRLDISTLVLYYESYADDFNQTKDSLLDFLDQGDVSEPLPFEAGKTYRGYYTSDEIRSVSKLLKTLATDTTWEHIRHYTTRG